MLDVAVWTRRGLRTLAGAAFLAILSLSAAPPKTCAKEASFAAASTVGEQSVTATHQKDPPISASGRDDGPLSEFLRTAPLPVIVTVIVGLSGLTATLASAFGTLIVTPRMTRSIAEMQATISRDALEVADKSAEAAKLSASAAETNAATSIMTATNVGIHEVARKRQDWINAIREILAQAHSDLMNWVPLKPNATQEEKAAYNTRVRATNTNIAKLRLMLNSREVASRSLLNVIERLNSGSATQAPQRMWLCRWLIRWSQIVLKTEWDRVRDELHGNSPAKPFRRGDRR